MDENQKKEDWNTFELDETAMIAFSEEDADDFSGSLCLFECENDRA